MATGASAPDFRWRELLLLLLSLLPVLADVVTDIVLVVDYWRKEHPYWSIFTLMLVIIPAALIQLFSMRWHLMDEVVSIWHWCSHFCLLGILHRYYTVIKTAIAAMKSESSHDFQKIYSQQSDICMLHLFESFLEAAPQLILQLYIMIMLREWHAFTAISAVASLCSLSWAIVNYLRVLRRARVDKACVRNPALFLQVIWRGAMLLARISALLLFAVGFHHWIFVLLGVHWFLMTTWVIHQKTDFCSSRPEEIFYNCVVGVIYCFCFFNLKEGQARYRMFVFYTIMITENILCLVLYFFLSEPDTIKRELLIISTALIIGGTIVGISSMFIFYRWFHPAGPIKWFIKKVEANQNNDIVTNKTPENNANLTLRSLKKPWVDIIEDPIKDEGISLENSPHLEVDCTDKKLLLDHWIARAGSPTFASVPIDKNESVNISGVEFYSVNNTPDKYNRSQKESNGVANASFQLENESRVSVENATKSQNKNKRRGICSPTELNLKFSSLRKNDLSDISDVTNNKKRRGICSSNQISKENLSKNDALNDIENLKSVSEISSKQTNSSNEKTSCDSINLDLDLSFSDINSSDINEFNENIVQKLCLSTLKNIKNVHQDADIQNIQRIALEILKDLYSKGGVKDDQDLESELSSSLGRDLDTPSEVLSTHDYENICAVNIAREAWGLRSWRACADMGASPPPPPLPVRRNPPILHDLSRDEYINSVAYELSRCEDNCQHRESPDYLKEPESTVFIAKPYVIDQNGGMFPLPTPLEPILEEIDEIIDSNSSFKKRHRNSALVATIDEIRHDTVTNSPRNVYHRADWDSPLNDPNLSKNVWKRQINENEELKSTPKKLSFERKYENCLPKKVPVEGFNKIHNSKKNTENRSTVTKSNALKTSPKIKTVSEEVSTQEHNLSYEEVVFLSQLVSDSESFLFKKSSNNISMDDISSLGISSSLQSLIDKDNHGSVAVPSAKQFDGRPSIKKNGNRPRRKFSLLREKFELKSKHSDEEMLFQSLESIKSISNKNLDVASSQNFLNNDANLALVCQEPKTRSDKENLTPECKTTPAILLENDSVVLSLTPTDIHQPNASVINLKEKRSLFLKQVLSPPKINSWNKK